MHQNLDPVQRIHVEALRIASDFKRTEKELQLILAQVEEKRVHLELGYASLFSYATEALDLSRDVALNHITVMRKGKEVAELAQAGKRGSFRSVRLAI